MFGIGEFARLARVSVKTLRHYDEADLLKPAHVARDTGYRYYRASQLPRLNRILILKELGFSLDQIGPLIDQGVDQLELQGMLRLRRAEQQTKLAEESRRLAAIELMIEQIAREGQPLEVMIKDSAPAWMVSVRDVVQSYPEIGRLYPEVYGQLGAKAMQGTPVAVWHDNSQQPGDIQAEAGVLFTEPVAVTGRVQCYQLPPVRVASYVHHGSFQQFKSVYERLTRWMEETGWRPSGPCREIYLHIGNPVRQDDESYVTEIQFPVTQFPVEKP
ncbi:MAG: MerR family transcriptional regulator [Acidobacteria bacterium]|nr:MerR family transcriptional regulator [Acidobacteriota bacterium]